MTEAAACSCCGRPLPPKGPFIWDFESRTITGPLGSIRFSERKAIYVDVLYRARNRGGVYSLHELVNAVYADDVNGGPDNTNVGSVHLDQIRKRLEPIGLTISKNQGRPRCSYQIVQI